MVRIALVQLSVTRDRAANVERGLDAAREAAENGAELVCYPELGFEWFWPQEPATPESLARAETVPGPTTESFSALAAELGVVVVLNVFERDGDQTYDTSPVIDADGTLLGKTRMVHIAELPGFHEHGYYAPGDRGLPVYETKAGRVGVAICYDRHYPESMRALALEGAELVVVPQAGAVDEWPEGLYEAEMQVAAFQNGYFTALVNRVGAEDNLVFAGESFVCDPLGQVLAQAPHGVDAILYADLDLAEVQESPARRMFMRDRRPELYGDWLG